MNDEPDRSPADFAALVRDAHRRGDGHGVPISVAFSELQRGEKVEHWIWYVFPQVSGLGDSTLSRRYGVRTCEHLAALLDDDEVRENISRAYVLAAEALSSRDGGSLERVFTIDVAKVVSSATLFAGYLIRHPRSDCSELQQSADVVLGLARSNGRDCPRTLVFLEDC